MTNREQLREQWIDRTLDAIATGTLTWDTQRLVDEAGKYER